MRVFFGALTNNQVFGFNGILWGTAPLFEVCEDVVVIVCGCSQSEDPKSIIFDRELKLP